MSPSLKSIRKLKKDLKRVNIIFINSENHLGSGADNWKNRGRFILLYDKVCTKKSKLTC